MALDEIKSLRPDRPADKVLLMTGGTSGIGRQTLERLLSRRVDWRVILLARSSPQADSLRELTGAKSRLTIVDADLADLQSVAQACDRVASLVGAGAIDAFALNAGVQTVSSDAASADGLELTFAVNFLAHFLIAERLKRLLRPGGRIIITSSELHDPAEFCLIIGHGRVTWQDPTELADPARSQQQYRSVVNRGEARYSASKLLNVIHARHLAKELPGIGVVAYNPSVVPGTEIGRDRNWFLRIGWKYLLPPLAPILPGARTVERAASDLLWLLADADAASLSGQYVDGRVPRPGSLDSRDPAKIAHAVEVARVLLDRHLVTAKMPEPGVPLLRQA
jgi:NAD(P)-dependent dehydrogenase (short-subunit alcohol dehydrogenase family)